MYNQELKKEYIKTLSSNGAIFHAKTIFDATEKYEVEKEADICTFNKEEIKSIIGEISGISSSSKSTRLSYLRRYSKWCLENNIPGAIDNVPKFSEISTSGADKLRSHTVANPMHLQRFLNCICEKEEEDTVDCVFRTYFWLAYSGIKEEDAAELTASNIDFPNMEIVVNGRRYDIYKESLPALRRCAELDSFRKLSANDKSVAIKRRSEGDKILRRTGPSSSIKILRTHMARKIRERPYIFDEDKDDPSLNLRLSYYRVGLSGIFYRMYQAEIAGVTVDFTPVASQFVDDKDYKDTVSSRKIKYMKTNKAKEYERDYIRWKEVYYS